MTVAELTKAKWAAALLITGRTEEAKTELLELIAATTERRPELLATNTIDLVKLKPGATA